MIWTSKSPLLFLGSDLKIKQATVCRLRQKADRRMKTVFDTCLDLAVVTPGSKLG
jgi:hypothetical protein